MVKTFAFSLLVFLLSGVMPPINASISDVARINSARLHLRRVTSKEIFIYVPCESQGTCTLVSLECKEMSRQTSTIVYVYKRRIFEQSEIANNTIERVISSLQENRVYEILTMVKINTSSLGVRNVTSKLTTKTCPKYISNVSRLRVVQAGPGWIDIRWKPVVDTTCHSEIFYLVNYYSTEWLKLGLFQDNNTVVFRPSHPCEAWPGEFCALLTDHVEPGRTHSIKINPVRYRGETLDPETFSGAVESKSATSNALISGSYDLGAKDAQSPCAPPLRPPPPVGQLLDPLPADIDPDQPRSDNSGVSLPVFGLAAAGLILIGVVVFAVIAVCCGRKRKKRESSGNLIRGMPNNQFPHVSRFPMSQENHTKNFDMNRPLPTPRVSNIYDSAIVSRDSNTYDDCRDASTATSIYEPLREPSTKPKATITPKLPQGCGSTSNAPYENFIPNDVYVPMGPPPPLYDDAQGITQTRESIAFRPSENYERPRQLPTYDEIMETHSVGPEYNRPYSTFADGKWKAWN